MNSATNYPKAAKYLLVAGFDKKNYVTIELYDFERGEWLPEIDPKKKCGRGSRLAIVGTRIYCVYGKQLEYMDISKEHVGEWQACKTLQTGRSNYSLAALNGHIYFIGGERRQIPENDVTDYDPKSALRYNTENDIWESVDDISETRSLLGLGTFYGSIYAVGGCPGDKVFSDVIEKYTPYTHKWLTVSPPMKVPRKFPGVAGVYECLFIAGGKNQNGCCKDIECFNTVNGTWYPGELEMNIARTKPGVINFNNKLLIVGGEDDRDDSLETIEIFDPETKTCTIGEIASMKIGKKRVVLALLDKEDVHPSFLRPLSEDMEEF